MPELFAAEAAENNAARLDYLAPEAVAAVMYLLHGRQAVLMRPASNLLFHHTTPTIYAVTDSYRLLTLALAQTAHSYV